MKSWNTPQVAAGAAREALFGRLILSAVLLLLLPLIGGTFPAASLEDALNVDWQWGVKIPLRDGVRLNATLYKPAGLKEPRPCVFTLTPYIGQSYHDRGMYF